MALWAARDDDGTKDIGLYGVKPVRVGLAGSGESYFRSRNNVAARLPDSVLPEIAPGECKRVKIVLADDQ